MLKQGKEEKREVAIGLRNNIDVQISSGLEAGDEVIVNARRRGGGLMAALLQLVASAPQLPFRRADGGGAEGSSLSIDAGEMVAIMGASGLTVNRR
ncbi:hypothetical protein M8494_16600 [Serratia ureilytica]